MTITQSLSHMILLTPHTQPPLLFETSHHIFGSHFGNKPSWRCCLRAQHLINGQKLQIAFFDCSCKALYIICCVSGRQTDAKPAQTAPFAPCSPKQHACMHALRHMRLHNDMGYGTCNVSSNCSALLATNLMLPMRRSPVQLTGLQVIEAAQVSVPNMALVSVEGSHLPEAFCMFAENLSYLLVWGGTVGGRIAGT